MIEHVPTFHPTREDLERPVEYFSTLRQAGEQFGVLRIVTPKDDRPQTLPTVTEPIETYHQRIHELQQGSPFEGGNDYTVEEYKTYAEKLKENWIEQHEEPVSDVSACDLDANSTEDRSSKIIEKAYWDIVERVSKEEVAVEYASDLQSKESSQEGGCKWRLSALVNADGNVLKHLQSTIAGVTSPWVYFGCLFSTFCWHTEDHYMSSINYLHTGSNKIWYAIPASQADDFEGRLTAGATTRSMCSDILAKLTLMLSPRNLPRSYPIFKAVQRPGDLILTFPRAFHGGYNEGWNCAEAVNFATMDWVKVGQFAANRLRDSERKKALFSHDRLLWVMIKAFEEKRENDKIPETLSSAMISACKEELSERRRLRNYSVKFLELVPPEPWPLDAPSWICSICDTPLFFSYFTCCCRSKIDHKREVTSGQVKIEVLCSRHATEAGAFECRCTPVFITEIRDADLREMMNYVERSAVGDNHSV